MQTRPPPDRLISSYGRRRGRPLRAGRAALLDDVLPRLAIPAPEPAATVDPRSLFPFSPKAVWLEVGFGAGEHLAAQAAAHPEMGLIGAEPYINGLAGLLSRVQESGLANIRLWPADIRLLLPALPTASIARIFILFPDPWPKARHHKRRLIAAPFLDQLARVMSPGAELRFATDDPGYLEWTLERLAVHAAFAVLTSQPGEWHTRPTDWPATRYEAKGLAGHPPAFLRFERRGERP
jgi:tRNA (guanine-N7-)-methyltransferase